MNYRHAFHAGNFADCMKHALLVWLLRAHGAQAGAVPGAGHPCGARAATIFARRRRERTGEWRHGIARLLEDAPAGAGRLSRRGAAARPLSRLAGDRPGAAAARRTGWCCCELHAEDNLSLRHLFGRDPQVAVHKRDAWEALGACCRPPSGAASC